MEKRGAHRIQVHGDCSGKMVLVEHVEVCDISETGIRLTCLKRVDMKSRHHIRIAKNDIQLNLKATVTRATMKGTREIDGKTVPVYEVAMQFTDLSDEDRSALKHLILLIEHA